VSRGDTLETSSTLGTQRGLDLAVERLSTAVAEARRRAQSGGRPVLACAVLRYSGLDPLTAFELGSAGGSRLLFLRPEDDFGLAGIGAAWMFACKGADRFIRADHAWRSMAAEAVTEGEGPRGPIVLYGFAFEDAGGAWEGFPAGLLIAPRVAVLQTAGGTHLLLSALVDPDDRADAGVEATLAYLRRCTAAAEPANAADGVPLHVVDEFPAQADWKRAVAETAQAVRDGRLRKAVLARGVRVAGGCLDPVAALRTLRREYPACTTFAIARGERCFLGASPEQLVRVHDGELHVAALAGSAPRGETEALDRRLADGLLASGKDRIEHALVVEALREALVGVATGIEAAEAPRLLTVHNTHHLYTPIRARLRERRSVLDLAGRLHPTPAVGGVPREAALAWIRRHEGWDRGWYAGPVGWSLGPDGDGDAAVAIRCALLEPGSARLFSGCGLVADSDPAQEFAESEWKLRPLLSALSGAAGPSRS
jgi:isochorismate synthase